MKKSNVRSFRYSDEVKEILEGFSGNSLNDKFENLVRHCYCQVPAVEERLKDLDTEINRKRTAITELSGEIFRINRFIGELNVVESSIKAAVRAAENISVTQ